MTTTTLDELATRLYAAVVSDALDLVGATGYVLASRIRPVGRLRRPLVARAATARAVGVDAAPERPYSVLLESMDRLEPGQVWVVATDGQGEVRSAIFGGLLATAAGEGDMRKELAVGLLPPRRSPSTGWSERSTARRAGHGRRQRPGRRCRDGTLGRPGRDGPDRCRRAGPARGRTPIVGARGRALCLPTDVSDGERVAIAELQAAFGAPWVVAAAGIAE